MKVLTNILLIFMFSLPVLAQQPSDTPEVEPVPVEAAPVVQNASPSGYPTLAPGDSWKSFTVRINPVPTLTALGLGGFWLSTAVDYAVVPKWTVGASFRLSSMSISNLPGAPDGLSDELENSNVSDKFSSYGFGIQGQYFFKHVNSDNWYVSPEFQYNKYSLPGAAEGDSLGLSQSLAGASIGYKSYSKGGFVFQFSVGLGYAFSNVTLGDESRPFSDFTEILDEVDESSPEVEGIKAVGSLVDGFVPMFDLSLGYSF